MSQYACYTCKDEGYVLWDDDQSRYREYSFFINLKHRLQEPKPCPDCNPDGKIDFYEDD